MRALPPTREPGGTGDQWLIDRLYRLTSHLQAERQRKRSQALQETIVMAGDISLQANTSVITTQRGEGRHGSALFMVLHKIHVLCGEQKSDQAPRPPAPSGLAHTCSCIHHSVPPQTFPDTSPRLAPRHGLAGHKDTKPPGRGPRAGVPVGEGYGGRSKGTGRTGGCSRGWALRTLRKLHNVINPLRRP